MENTHIPLQKWSLAILLMSRDTCGVSPLELARDLDISNENARRMALNIKSAMSARESIYMLSGNIEMDEFSYQYNRRKIHKNICERIYEIAATEAKVFRSRNHGKSEAGK
jgi:hypothetical protein